MSSDTADALGTLVIDSGTGDRQVRLADYLDADAEESAAIAAHAWIKALRLARVDGQRLRSRFLVREDSLWWFAELYLHKTRVVLNVHRALAAIERLISVERPIRMRPVGSNRLLSVIGPEVARARKIAWTGAGRRISRSIRLLVMDARARGLMLASRASRLRHQRAQPLSSDKRMIAAFVHNAFWRRGARAGSPESYIGPVLEALEARDDVRVNYVGVGPAANFKARRWWHPLRSSAAPPRVTPIESFAARGSRKDSAVIWRRRHAMRRSLWKSQDIRRHAVIRGCNCWDIVREELAGVALLQWPWSARAMDEAGAALDALRPAVALTYAEAGGWGRALTLECRRRGIPSAGLQHGFIHRHWLNYRHEPDEMLPDPDHRADAGFPRPALTLLFDEFARHHLATAGHFPPESLAVTGSPRLDAMVRDAGRLTPEEIRAARVAAGADDERLLVLVVTKYQEAARVLPALAEAVRAMPDVQLAIKTHPAETPGAYAAVAAAAPNITVLPADAPLAPLLRASRAVVTVNSTVAVDAAVLGVPALVIGLPNNLSPFVDAGAMAGAAHGDSPGPALQRILYDEGFRQQLERDRGAYLARFGIGSDDRAAVRSAAAVIALADARSRPPAVADPFQRKD
jgi:hypothetical protein